MLRNRQQKHTAKPLAAMRQPTINFHLNKKNMKRILFSAFFLLFVVTGFSQQSSNKRQLKIVTVSGNGYERGYQHGQQMKKEIAELMLLWKKDLEQNFQMPADTFIHNFLSATDFIPAIKKYTPDILDEVRGIAKGSDQSFNDLLAFQLVDEYWVYGDKLINDTIHHHCSDVGIPAMNGRPAYVSQNMDLDSWMDGYQIVLHIKRHGNTPEQFVLSCAGVIALTGINENGIGVCVNTLMQLQASGNGLPVAFVIRGLLEKKKNEALQFIQTTKHASGQNYTIGIVDSVYDFEASANKVVRLYPDASGIVYHTNHPVVNDDVKPWYQDYYKSFLAGTTQNKNSEVRFATLKKRANETTDKSDVFLKTTLRSKDDNGNPVCRAHLSSNGFFTFGSVIMTLSNKRSLQVTAGPPDESEYQTFSFDKH